MTYLRLAILSVTLILSGCGASFWLPPAHKIDIQQGNLISPDQIALLEKGMSRDQVRRLLGEPVLKTAFGANRWDYVLTRGKAGEHVKAQNLIVYFQQDKVSDIIKEYIDSSNS